MRDYWADPSGAWFTYDRKPVLRTTPVMSVASQSNNRKRVLFVNTTPLGSKMRTVLGCR